MWQRLKSEPALIVGIVVAVVALVVAFGVPISEDQKAGIVGVVTAVLALLGNGAVVRSAVTPNTKVPARKADES